MKRLLAFALAASLAVLIMGCGKKEPPDYVKEICESVLSQKDDDALGKRIELLEDLRVRYQKYTIAERIERELQKAKSNVTGRFDLARQLARQGEFDRAEKILKDLANHLGSTSEGRQAAEYLRFEFYRFAAQQLMLSRLFDRAEVFLDALDPGRLDSTEKARVQGMLDTITTGKKAQNQVMKERFATACNALRETLLKHRAKFGSYPERFSLDLVTRMSARNRFDITEALSAIEDYQTDGETFSMTVVSSGGALRVRITQDGVER